MFLKYFSHYRLADTSRELGFYSELVSLDVIAFSLQIFDSDLQQNADLDSQTVPEKSIIARKLECMTAFASTVMLTNNTSISGRLGLLDCRSPTK